MGILWRTARSRRGMGVVSELSVSSSREHVFLTCLIFIFTIIYYRYQPFA